MDKSTRTRLTLTPIAIFVAVVVVSAAAAMAAIPDGQGVIHGCYRKSNGTLRVIDRAKGQHCVTGERALDWNERGRRGSRGPRGLRGLQGLQGEPGDTTLGLDYLSASSVLNDDPASHTISFTVPEGTVVKTLWYREKITTPAGPCDALPEADSIVGNHEMNGGFANQFGGFNLTVIPGTTFVPGIGSDFYGSTSGVLFPGAYEFATLVTNNNLVPDCWGTVIETQVFLETET